MNKITIIQMMLVGSRNIDRMREEIVAVTNILRSQILGNTRVFNKVEAMRTETFSGKNGYWTLYYMNFGPVHGLKDRIKFIYNIVDPTYRTMGEVYKSPDTDRPGVTTTQYIHEDLEVLVNGVHRLFPELLDAKWQAILNAADYEF